MDIQPGQHVKCFFKAGTVVEGIVKSWSKDESELLSLNDNNLMVILHTYEDLMLVKVVLEEPPQEIVAEDPSINPRKTPQEWLDAQPKEWIKEKLAEVLTGSDDPDLDKMNMTQLRQLVHEQEKEMIAQKKKEHFGTPSAPKRSVPYSNPWGQSAYYQRSRKKQ
jgi:hypothetical protein